MKKAPLKYLDPKSTQTLREGIKELRYAEGFENDAAENLAPELAGDIDSHDAIHVLFACPTALVGEIIAHVWTLFGTTTKLADMHRVNMHDDHKAVLSQIGHFHLLRTWILNFPKILLTLVNANRMRDRWPVERLESFLDLRLCDIRRDFQIKLVSFQPPKKRNDDEGSGAALRNIRQQKFA